MTGKCIEWIAYVMPKPLAERFSGTFINSLSWRLALRTCLLDGSMYALGIQWYCRSGRFSYEWAQTLAGFVCATAAHLWVDPRAQERRDRHGGIGEHAGAPDSVLCKRL